MKNWQRDLYVLTASQLLIRLGWTLVKPYLAFYIPQLGVTAPEKVVLWAGILGSIQFLAQSVVSPFWGAAADKFGKKSMVVRSVIALSILDLLMAFAGNVYQLAALRVGVGLFAGYNAAALALVASNAPPEKLGYAVGLLQTGVMAGTVLGPAVGGVVAEFGGYRWGFVLAGVMAVLLVPLIIFIVRDEQPKQKTVQEEAGKAKPVLSGWRIVITSGFLLVMLGVIIVTQFASQGMDTLLAVLIAGIYHGKALNLVVAGIFMISALTNVVISPFAGKLGDKYGHLPIIIMSLTGVAIFSALQGIAHNVIMLGAFRLFAGAFIGASLPNVHAIIGKKTPIERRGAVFGIVASATSLGNFIGPLTGGIIAATYGIVSVLFVTGIVSFLAAVACMVTSKKEARSMTIGA